MNVHLTLEIWHGETAKRIEEGWLSAKAGELVDGDQVFDRIDSELEAADVAEIQN